MTHEHTTRPDPLARCREALRDALAILQGLGWVGDPAISTPVAQAEALVRAALSGDLGGGAAPDVSSMASGAAPSGAGARERELVAENQRLREANRRLQTEGPALERDKLIVQLRAEIERLTDQRDYAEHRHADALTEWAVDRDELREEIARVVKALARASSAPPESSVAPPSARQGEGEILRAYEAGAEEARELIARSFDARADFMGSDVGHWTAKQIADERAIAGIVRRAMLPDFVRYRRPSPAGPPPRPDAQPQSSSSMASPANGAGSGARALDDTR